MSGASRAAAAAALGLALALTGAAPAEAQVDMIATGVPGPVSLLTFAGDTETARKHLSRAADLRLKLNGDVSDLESDRWSTIYPDSP